MKKRWMLMLATALVTFATCLAVQVFVFPERFFVSGSVDSIASVEIVWKPFGAAKTVVLTEDEDIEAFYRVLAETSSLSFNPFPHHMEGLYSNPVYTLTVTYKNGDTAHIITQEGGQRIYRLLGTKTDHGDKGYIGAQNEALLEWARERSVNL